MIITCLGHIKGSVHIQYILDVDTMLVQCLGCFSDSEPLPSQNILPFRVCWVFFLLIVTTFLYIKKKVFQNSIKPICVRHNNN